MITSTLGLARHGRDHGYAVLAVNVFDDVSLRAVVDAAVAMSSPLVVQVSVKTVRSIGTGLTTAMFRAAAIAAAVPVALHLDHCPDPDVAADVVRAGWSSLLFDASDRDLVTAERETAKIVAMAHASGVDVESEVENIIGAEDGVGSEISRHSYPVEMLAAVAERTGADLIAPHLGTAHGVYASRPELRPDRARELASLTDRPLVLHGGTGLTEAEFRAFINAGVSKINISTAVKVAYMTAARDYLAAADAVGGRDPLAMAAGAGRAISEEVTRHILIFGSEGRAQAASARGTLR